MQSVQVSEYMNRHPVVFHENMAIEEAVELLLKTEQRGGPVVDDKKKVIGFLSEQDCLATMLRDTYHKEQTATVGDCMFRGDVLTVKLDAAVMDLAQNMSAHKPKIYPVTDYQHKLVGIVSRTDILRALDMHLRDSYDQKTKKTKSR
ncbi:CBS domain-containing protein [Pseudidiomarina planktonica]|uniref:CBS domain-containing protein n=1 Tax=Pseudidiomarina planktonica TaxID=1323738 RepID=A0A1Y6ERJ9_9GAMM|nr:CBS domain-containing protein [Pseudidiomarina planktonica]RUO65363.1 CBS domain-containing protein [Pseudidiomarina planktonica]SMQ65314.1 CBS domain-containing protein [Pseudidiomarina planktonica]